MTKPFFVLLAGPNGTGKSTLYELYIKDRFDAPFINADEIQRDELKKPEMTASIEAAKIAKKRREQFIAEGKDLISETVFSHDSKLQLVRDAKMAGYIVYLFHLSLESEELAIRRVKERFENGGHNVPENKIRERYHRCGPLIREAAKIADFTFVYDASRVVENEDGSYDAAPPRFLLRLNDGRMIEKELDIPAWAAALYL